MKTRKEKLLTAADLMQKKVVCIDAGASVEEAVGALEDAGIGGAPVLDARGKLIGVISLRDLAPRARFTEREASRGKDWGDEDLQIGEGIEEDISMADDYSPGSSAPEQVRDYMSSGVVSVPPDLPIRDVAARLVKEKIHRVFVVDGNKLLGVISTFDLARAVAEDLV
ncbi:MAG: CBS domain-containing protein [Planctomycetota bacterium]|nr:CBS domain-containing protein [Planctomycetota bacterium]